MTRTLCCCLAVAGLTTGALAERFDLFIFENADGADVSGLDLWVDVIDRGTYADFVFHNDSTVDSFVRSIYLESTDWSTASLSVIGIEEPQPLGVKFVEGGSPKNPAGAIQHFGGEWQGNLFAGKAKKGGSGKDGLDAGEHVVFQFGYNGIDFAQLISAMSGDSPEFRIGQHVQGLDGGYSVWGKNGEEPTVVPLPSAAASGLAGLALVGLRRRR